ncbi:Outer membrane cobalamin receptor protein [Ekhidna lutea]|uniref:Outer membrane cobalamin receptor protein n=1 Tax=Ekhidna lutea TaxID=447679 RepID=A0A239LCM3_EKHLU|nr:carboxypeptidase-like regulatory domain-containing protein [Ekhidna lutea]SNT28055.1 Outer membrane cobalamin receptor protein [Ekhidna lutea]
MRAIILLPFLFICSSLFAQTTISGRVAEKSGEPLLGVNVYIKGTYDGATTDINGNFSFTTYEEDSLILVASFIGFHEINLPLSKDNEPLLIRMREKVSELNAVVITAGAFHASEEGKREVLKPLDIVTTAGATADVPGALNTLPGTQTVGETGRLFVRGGDGRETKTFIDGMLVHNEYSPSAPNTPGRSRFSPFMFKGMSFSTGGYSAEYGQALSSALILQSKDLAENDRTDISLMSVGADVSTTQATENSSFAGKVQYTNLTPYFKLVDQNLKWDKAPEEYNSNLAYRVKTSETGMLKFYSNASRSDMELYESDIANPELELPVKVQNDYAHFNVSYRELLGENWGLKTGASFTKSDDFAALDTESRDQNLTGFHGKVVADYQYSDRLGILGGVELIRRNVDQILSDESGSFEQDFNEQLGASFLEAEWFASSSLGFKAGLRAENNSLTSKNTLTPRLSAAYKTGDKSQVSLAYGQFYQAPQTQIILSQPSASSEKATHFIANYQWLSEGQSFRVEAYDKRYDNLTRYSQVFDPSTYAFDGYGYARGLDLFWRDTKTFKNTDYWVSYSYLDTERAFKDFPGSFTPTFASTHNFSVVVKKFIDEIKSQVGLTYAFASERTYHDPNTDRFLSGRTPAYHDLSFNISYLYSNQVIVHAMVNNVLGINNIYGYEFADTADTNGVYAGRAITPAARRFIFLGVFITLSKNKGINQLPNL